MGNCRLIYKGAFNHPDIIGLTAEQNLFYIGLIVFADDEGRMEANPIFLKSLVLPYQEISSKTIIEALNALAAKNLITLYEVEEKQYLYHPKWLDWQHLRQNRIKQSNCPNPPLGGQMSALGGQMADKCQAKLSKVKLSKVNLTKVNPAQPSADASPVKVLIDSFFQKLETRLGEKPASFNGGAAGRGFKALLKHYHENAILSRMDAWFNTEEPFIVKRGWRIEDFLSNFNRLTLGPLGGYNVGKNQLNAPIAGTDNEARRRQLENLERA